ncbi:MAG: hypothetical protein WCD53_28855 [Microcoleus sp.]
MAVISNPVASELLPKASDKTVVSLQLIVVGKRHCRLLYIIPVQPELILHRCGGCCTIGTIRNYATGTISKVRQSANARSSPYNFT